MTTVLPEPFPHVIVDQFADAATAAAARQQWPSLDWQWWVRYDTPEQKKLACPDWKVIPSACRQLLAQMMVLPLRLWFPGAGAVPDSMLWGGGLHSMGRGDYLGLHLDHSHHPHTGLQRAFSAVLFLNDDWRTEWGGQLVLWDAARRQVVQQYEPCVNRLVVFQCSDVSYHSVLGPLQCPEGVQRKSLALYYHAESAGPVLRPRAEFFAKG